MFALWILECCRNCMKSIEKILISPAFVTFLGAVTWRAASTALMRFGGVVGAAMGARGAAGALLAFVHDAAYIAHSL
jgi:hypothetical protein